MEATDRLLDIIEDHESITQFLGNLAVSLSDGGKMPNFVPVLHDSLLTDYLSKICEKLMKTGDANS